MRPACTVPKISKIVRDTGSGLAAALGADFLAHSALDSLSSACKPSIFFLLSSFAYGVSLDSYFFSSSFFGFFSLSFFSDSFFSDSFFSYSSFLFFFFSFLYFFL